MPTARLLTDLAGWGCVPQVNKFEQVPITWDPLLYEQTDRTKNITFPGGKNSQYGK